MKTWALLSCGLLCRREGWILGQYEGRRVMPPPSYGRVFRLWLVEVMFWLNSALSCVLHDAADSEEKSNP